jgi:hypothetical protein
VADPRIVLGALLLLLGCPEPGESGPCQDDSGPSLLLGTGESGFVPLEGSPPDLELVHGPQGGYHLLLGFQAKNVDSEHFVSIEATGHIEGELLASSERWASLRCNADSGYLEGANFFLIYDSEPEALVDQLTAIDVLLRDNDGIEATASLTVRIIDRVEEQGSP